MDAPGYPYEVRPVIWYLTEKGASEVESGHWPPFVDVPCRRLMLAVYALAGGRLGAAVDENSAQICVLAQEQAEFEGEAFDTWRNRVIRTPSALAAQAERAN